MNSTVTYTVCDLGEIIEGGIFTVQETGTWHFTFTAIVRTVAENDDKYGLKMTKGSVGTRETIIGRAFRANYRDFSEKSSGHYETLSMSAITKVEVGEEVSVKVNEKDSTGNYIGGVDQVARFTGFKLS